MRSMEQHRTTGKAPERTGIPVQMKRSFEARSGLSFDDVRVHYGSDRPARLGALAYTQGSQVFLGPGQERHLAHELGHVVQQKRGLVRPTAVIGGLPLNDDPALERAADAAPSLSGGAVRAGAVPVVQRKVGFEFQTVGGAVNVRKLDKQSKWVPNTSHGTELFKTREGIRVTADGSDLEYVTPAVETSAEGTEAKKIGDAAASIHRDLKAMCECSTTDHLRTIRDAMPTDPEEQKVNVQKADGTEEMIGPKLDFLTKKGSKDKREKGMRIDLGDASYWIHSLGETAHPHATVGVKLVAIPELMRQLAGKTRQFSKTRLGTVQRNDASCDDFLLGLTTNKFVDNVSAARKPTAKAEILDWQIWTLTSAVEEADRAINAAWGAGGPAEPARQEMRALLAVLVAYNRQFCILFQHQGGSANAKNAMPIMLRTSLYDIYKHAVPEDQTYPALFEAAFNEIHWAQKELPQRTEPDGSVLKKDAVLLGEIYYDEEAKQEVRHMVTVEEWLDKVKRGEADPIHTGVVFHSVDEIYTGPGSDIPSLFGRFQIPGLAPGVSNKDALNIGLPDGGPGILAELRGLERNVKYERWGALTKAVAVTIHNVNNTVVRSAPTVPTQGPVQRTHPTSHGPTHQGSGALLPVRGQGHSTTAVTHLPQQQQQQTLPAPHSTLAAIRQIARVGTTQQQDPPQTLPDHTQTATRETSILPRLGQGTHTQTAPPPVIHTQTMQPPQMAPTLPHLAQGPFTQTAQDQWTHLQMAQPPVGRSRLTQGRGDLTQLPVVRGISINLSQRPGNPTRSTQGQGDLARLLYQHRP